MYISFSVLHRNLIETSPGHRILPRAYLERALEYRSVEAPAAAVGEEAHHIPQIHSCWSLEVSWRTGGSSALVGETLKIQGALHSLS